MSAANGSGASRGAAPRKRLSSGAVKAGVPTISRAGAATTGGPRRAQPAAVGAVGTPPPRMWRERDGLRRRPPSVRRRRRPCVERPRPGRRRPPPLSTDHQPRRHCFPCQCAAVPACPSAVAGPGSVGGGLGQVAGGESGGGAGRVRRRRRQGRRRRGRQGVAARAPTNTARRGRPAKCGKTTQGKRRAGNAGWRQRPVAGDDAPASGPDVVTPRGPHRTAGRM